ncbi:concanavalin A-like lectin/glucanase domain-containing protein [Rhizophagus diaphanus]|nr:concanavalin A-like lectin/glucanase domain-containing protein [Rhizophagus diaphanus] [Rhizophagus sp. MUCL 43196]
MLEYLPSITLGNLCMRTLRAKKICMLFEEGGVEIDKIKQVTFNIYNILSLTINQIQSVIKNVTSAGRIPEIPNCNHVTSITNHNDQINISAEFYHQLVFKTSDTARSHKTDLNRIREVHINETNYTWDESCDTSLFIEENGKLVSVKSNCNLQTCVKANLTLKNQGIFEWDVIIEKLCEYVWIGVCAPENFKYLAFAGYQTTGWILGSNGLCWNSHKEIRYCLPFGEGTRITVHLDINKRTCAFTVNGIRYPEVSTWNNLLLKLYPVVGLIYPGRFQIQSYRKV